MNDTQKEALTAMDKIVEWAREREVPPGEWTKPLMDVLKDNSLFSLLAKQFPFPFGIFNRDGVFELANDILLEETAFDENDIKAGRLEIYGVESVEFRNAVKLALQGETNVINGLIKPLEDIGTGYANEKYGNVCAILVPIIEDKETIFRVAVMFLPFEYCPEKA